MFLSKLNLLVHKACLTADKKGSFKGYFSLRLTQYYSLLYIQLQTLICIFYTTECPGKFQYAQPWLYLCIQK